MRPSDRDALQRYFSGPESAEGEQRAFCPLHENPETSKTPSASFNFDQGVWNCLNCPGGGSIGKLRKDIIKRRREAASAESNVTPIARGKELPSDETLRLWHERLMQMPDRLAVLTGERGLLQETIELYQLGWDGTRYTIPIRDVQGVLVNVRRYNPKASKSQDKMFNIEGHGQARIMNPAQLARYDRVVLTEGEMDKFVGEQMGLQTVTHTAGAGTFLPVWGPLFAGKEVYVCYDCDDAGRRGALKAAKLLAPHADMVCLMDLDLDTPGGDITDFFVKQGNTKDEFERLMDLASKSPIGAKRADREVPKQGKPVSLEASQSVQYGNEPLEMVVTVSGKQVPVYEVPREVTARCTQDKGTVCAVCPMAALNGEAVQRLQPNDPFLLEFIDANNMVVEKNMRKLFGARCADRVEYEVDQKYAVEELIVTDSVDSRGEDDAAPISRRLLNVGTFDTRYNSTARVVGRQLPDPKTQRGLFMSWLLEQTQTDLDKFEMNPRLRRMLGKFQVKPGQKPLAKLKAIANDLSANVTQIYGRPELHVAYDLVWHSVLDFEFMGKRVGKGWLEMLVVGDTRTGKSETATRLARHYNAGVLKSCEGATFAGLVGGAQQLAQRWTVTWGVIPLQDRRLVVLDEMSGLADKDVIENMSSIRSSGRAQITKVVQQETSARTRLIWIANPADGRRLEDTAGSGMTAIATLVKNPEDIARLDFAMAASGSDVPMELINTTDHHAVRHRYDQESCEALVMWAWSRTRDQVRWAKGAEQAAVDAAVRLGKTFVSEPPLVQVENVRMKVARIAVAIAARLFSTDRTGQLVVVTKDHVEAAVEFLEMVYGMESFGYLRHSRKVLNGRKRAQEMRGKVTKWLGANQHDVLHTLRSIRGDVFRTRDFVDLAAMDPYEAQAATRYLIETAMVQRMSKGYLRMEPALVGILNKLEDAEEA